MASGQTRPEPMNASPHHSKVKVSLTLAGPVFVAGGHISGKMEMECRADKGLGISVMMVELFASQELTSRDHSATSMFLHSRRLFQGPGLPPSNAVQAHPLPGDPPLPQHHHQARRGISTFLFRIPLPSSAPSSISFGPDLAKVKYEVRASVGVWWKGEKRLVVCKREVEVVESWEQDFGRTDPEAVVVGEFGKIWVMGKLVGGVAVAGESACVELQVKNHSSKKNTGLTLTLSRNLILPPINPSDKSRLHLSETLTTVPFRGAEYIIPPGAEGVASLVFDVPTHARGVRGGPLEGDEAEKRTSESLFEIRCIVGVKLTMGLGSKDINLELPVVIVHPLALPDLPIPYNQPEPYPYIGAPSPPQAPYSPAPGPSAYTYPALPMSPPLPAFVDQHHVWLPPPMSPTPHPHQYYTPPLEVSGYYFPPPPTMPMYLPPRPLSAGPQRDGYIYAHEHTTGGVGLPSSVGQHLRLPVPLDMAEAEEGKGERASRVTQHLRLSSRHRSVSPRSHRFPLPTSHPVPVPPLPIPIPNSNPVAHRNLPVPPQPQGPIEGSASSPTSASQDPIVHSPRPFLSPKQSYSQDPITHGSVPKSVRVEELERMADAVVGAVPDLSGDIPRDGGVEGLGLSVGDEGGEKKEDPDLDVNKTLPKPPVPTVDERRPSPLPQRARADLLFATLPEPTLTPTLPSVAAPTLALVPEPAPFPAPVSPPAQCTPPTPTLTATTPAKAPRTDHLGVIPDVRTDLGTDLRDHKVDGKAESGLDALERRLLAEVGTRRLDSGGGFGGGAGELGEVRGVGLGGVRMGVGAGSVGGGGGGREAQRRPDVRGVLVQPITIPTTKPDHEPLNDSAISSLTLAGERELEFGLDHEHEEVHGFGQEEKLGDGFGQEQEGRFGVEEEHDSDEKTHRAAKSSVSGGEDRSERRKRRKDREREREGKSDKKSDKDGGRDGEKKSGRRRDRGRDGEGGHKARKSAAKGRVAAWLGGIEPEVPPPPEEVDMHRDGLSVARAPGYPFEPHDFTNDRGVDDTTTTTPSPPRTETHAAGDKERPVEKDPGKTNNEEGTSASPSAPNPRSSGFVPIGSLQRHHHRPTMRDLSITEEARKVTEMWAVAGASPALPVVANEPSPKLKEPSPKIKHPSPKLGLFVRTTPVGVPQVIGTDRRVSPPSGSGPQAQVREKEKTRGLERGRLDAIWTPVKPYSESEPQPRHQPQPVQTQQVQPTPHLPPKSPKSPKPSPRLPVFPPPPLPQALGGPKYDIRSARGGRGGKVTAVASIWAAGAFDNESKTKPSPSPLSRDRDLTKKPSPSAPPPNSQTHTSPPPLVPAPTRAPIKPHLQNGPLNEAETKLIDAEGVRLIRPVVKSSSVPAVISESHATPVISSTASLARVPLAGGGGGGAEMMWDANRVNKVNRVGHGPVVGMGVGAGIRVGQGARVPTTIIESFSEDMGKRGGVQASVPGLTSPTKNAGAGGDLAFGQARLRDLIRKYQGA